MHLCTVVEPRHLPWARGWVAAARRVHPDATCVVLVAGEEQAGRPELDGAEVLLPVDVDGAPLDVMTLVHGPHELFAALTPWLLRHLLARGAEVVVHVAPQALLRRPLAGLEELAREHGVVLVPRTFDPVARDGRQPDEQALMQCGVFTRALVAVAGDEGSRMVAWWAERTATSAQDDRPAGRYLDQRWLDLVPGLFDHTVVKDPGWNVSRDDLGGRTLERDASGALLVDGRPVTLLDLTGYDPRMPHLAAADQRAPARVLLGDHPVLREVCDEVRAELLAQPEGPDTAPFAVRDGVLVDDRVRTLARAELARPQRGEPTRPGPWDMPLDRWLCSPDEEGEVVHLGRYLASVYTGRPDLRAAFPELRNGRRKGFLNWVAERGAAEIGPILASCPALSDPKTQPRGALLSRGRGAVATTRLVPGVEVVGYLTAELGLGEAARQFVAGFEEAGIPVSTNTYSRLSSRRGVAWTDREPEPGTRHDTLLMCVSPEALPDLCRDLGQAALRDRHRIGLWFWELTDFPASLHPSFDLLDEIWVASEFNAETLRAHTDKPVVVMPLPTHAPAYSDSRIPEVPDDGTFTFLFVFDYLSILERKNPMAAVAAFRAAFPTVGQARLVIKTINGERKQNDRERLRCLISDRSDIVLIERYLTRDELDGLMHHADCYVSLHRSEGFGLTLSESMAIGKPVVATAYSGNMEFTREDNSYLVPSTLVPVPPGNAPYLPPATWADPDVEVATALLRRIVADQGDARERGRRARETIEAEFSVPALAAALTERYAELTAARAAAALSLTAPTAPREEPVRRRRWGRARR
jgi:glycosyltransferase involved in cell wall biosynthesis